MRIFNNLNDLPNFKNAVVTIGSFDGVHQGHQKILEQVNNLAEEANGESVVVTFHPHPRLVVFPNDDRLKLITTIDEKVKLFERFEIDNVVVVPFTVEFSRQSADEYIEKFLYGKFKPHIIVIGYDHRFGRNRIGDINYLKFHSQQKGFEVIEIKKQDVESITVSSTKIRKALQEGDVANAGKLLGHYYTLTGKIIHGQHVGTSIGYPTANLEITKKYKLIPPDGVYAVHVLHKENKYLGMLYIGNRPTLNDNKARSIEVNIFDFNKDIYNDHLTVEFIDHVRHDQSFSNLEELKAQLKKDKESSLQILQEKKKNLPNVSATDKVIPSVAVVILNYNGWHYLEKYLPNVLQTDYDNLRIIVADNGSTDGSLARLKQYFPKVETINLEQNHGFAEGYNLALARVKAKYFILLNSDIAITNDWINPIIQKMEKDKTIAAAQPKVLAEHNRQVFEYAGAAGGMIDKWGYPLCRGRIFDTVEEDKGQFEEEAEIFWASGAALFIKANLYKEIGGLDGEYFAHMEEIDLCYRLKRAGYKVMYYPQATVYHVGGGTLNYQSPFKTYLNFRNSLYTLFKNETKGKLLWLIPFRLVLDGVAGMLFIVKGQFGNVKAIIKAHWTFFLKIRHLVKRRKHFAELVQKVSIGENVSTGTLPISIIWQYYARGRKHFNKLKFQEKKLDYEATEN